MFNDLETTFWSYFLEQNDWNYIELKDDALHFPDFLNISEVIDQFEFKTILLYLTLSGYAIKVIFILVLMNFLILAIFERYKRNGDF